MTMDLGEGHERVTLEGNPTSIRKYSISVQPIPFDSASRRFLFSRNEAIDEPPILRFHLFHFVTFTIEGWPRWCDERRREARKKRVRAIHAVTASGGGTIVVVRTDHPSERKVAPPKANLIVNLGVHRKLRNSLAA